MKCYGYSKTEPDELRELSEVTFHGTAEQLIELSNFLLDCIEIMKTDPAWEHSHLSDNTTTNQSNLDVDVIVFAKR